MTQTTYLGDYTLSTDKTLLDIEVIHRYLSNESYWARGIPRAVVEKSIQGSLCFGIFYQGKQVGFARVVTDGATFGYLADVFVLDGHRAKGLSKWLIRVILEIPELQGLRRIMLGTRDAHGLYAQFGFGPLTQPERIMQIHRPDIYGNFVS